MSLSCGAAWGRLLAAGSLLAVLARGAQQSEFSTCSSTMTFCAYKSLLKLDFYNEITCEDMLAFYECAGAAMKRCTSYNDLAAGIESVQLFMSEDQVTVLRRCFADDVIDVCDIDVMGRAVLVCNGGLYQQVVVEHESHGRTCSAIREARACVDERVYPCRHPETQRLPVSLETVVNKTIGLVEAAGAAQEVCARSYPASRDCVEWSPYCAATSLLGRDGRFAWLLAGSATIYLTATKLLWKLF